MKKILLILLIPMLLLTGGTKLPPSRPLFVQNVSAAVIEEKAPAVVPLKTAPKPAQKTGVLQTKSVPPAERTIEETVTAFFERQYEGYLSLRYIDASDLVNMEKRPNVNMLKWLKIMMMRRRLMEKNDLGYVDTQRLGYKIVFDREPNDHRMQLWDGWTEQTGETIVHFHIEGEAGKVYPPFMAPNAQHSMFLKKHDGVWKIEMHYFPGSARKFTEVSTIKVPDEAEMLKQLKQEFAGHRPPEEPDPLENARTYHPDIAVKYAEKYTEQVNSQFERLGDWTGDCANFVSQCLWAGFGGGDSMTAQWQNGSAAWVNVNSFWQYIISDQALKGQKIAGIRALIPGDIIQTRTASGNSQKERFTHTLLLVDAEKLIFAQNTPAAFVYYSDLSNVEARFVRPNYLVK